MRFRRFTAYLLSNVLCFQAIAPCFAMELNSVDKLEDNIVLLQTYSSLSSPLSFKAQHGRTAAGTLLYGIHEGKVKILLGQRSDGEKKWCNLGGGSEEVENEEVFLFNTAGRETDEESNNLYCPHPYLIKSQPFIDTFNGSLFYRMYWQNVQYLDRGILLKLLERATSEGREFTNFMWVDANLILNAVTKQNPIVSVDDKTSIEIYPELFTTLSTLSGKGFIESLVKHQKIKRFDQGLRPLINQLYLVGKTATTSDSKPMLANPWAPVCLDSNAELGILQEQAQKNMFLSPLPLGPVLTEDKLNYVFELNKFLQQKDSYLNVIFPPNSYQTITLDKPEDKQIIARAVAAHLAGLIELKRLFNKRNKIKNELEEFVESYTDMSLRIILGPDYKTSKNFPDAQDSQDAADEANIKIFLNSYYGSDELLDGKREVQLLPSDPLFIKAFLKKGRKNGLKPIFYNATNDSLYALFLFFTQQREFMMATPLKGLPGLRGTDIYFKGVESMNHAINKYGYRDYQESHATYMSQDHAQRKSLVLCGNFTALAGLKTTKTSSSSLEYALNNHAVSPPDLGSTIQEALALSGFNNPTNKYFYSLFQQFISHIHPEYANSVMLAIQMDPELLETYTYAAFGGGSPYTRKCQDNEESDKKLITPAQVFEELQIEADRQKNTPESFEQDKERKRSLIPEARLLISPEIMFTDKVQVRAFPRFLIGKEQKKLFKQEAHLSCMAMIGDWLSEENHVLEGAFCQYPVAKSLYKRVHLGVTGYPVEEKLSFEGFFYLVQHGYVEAVKEYIQNFPTFLTDHVASKKRLVLAALRSNTPDMLKLILIDQKDQLQIEPSENEITKLLRVAKDSNWDQSAQFLFEYLSKSSHSLLESYFPVLYQLFQPKLKFGFPSENDFEKRINLIALFGQSSNSPEWFKNKIIRQLFSTTLAGARDEICTQILYPRMVISPIDLLYYIQKDLSSSSWGQMSDYGHPRQQSFLNALKQNSTENLLFQKGLTEDPLLFDLVHWKAPLCKDLLTYLQAYPEVFTLTNKEGWGLLAAAQKAHLEGHSSENLMSIIYLYKETNLDLGQHSYPPFFQLYGDSYKHKDHSFELAYSKNSQWSLEFSKATIEDLKRLLLTCPDAKLLNRFSYKIKTLLLSEIIRLRLSLEAPGHWIENFKRALLQKQPDSQIKNEFYQFKPFNFLEAFSGIQSLEGDRNQQIFARIQSTQNLMEKQFSHVETSLKHFNDEPQKSLEELLFAIPESIKSIKFLLKELKNADYFRSGIIGFFQSLPEFEEVRVVLENRKENLSRKRNEWLEGLERLIEENNKSQLYSYVQSMPYLSNKQIERVYTLLTPYFEEESLLLKNVIEPKSSYMLRYLGVNAAIEESFKIKLEEFISIADLIRENEDAYSPLKIQNFVEEAPTPVLRKSLPIFMKKKMLSYLPDVLKRAYDCSQDFVKEFEFHERQCDVYPTLPSNYNHPFPFALMGEDPVSVITCFLPYLDAQDAPSLLNNFDGEQFWKLIKCNKASDVETLVTLVPWVFQWQYRDTDFFLTSLKCLPKLVLRTLVMSSLDKLKDSEINNRCLPYFVYLMMDGQNASIIKEALTLDPSLLEIKSLDGGLGMDDFLLFYASPSIRKVIQDFQKDR